MKKFTALFLSLLLIVVPISTVQASEGNISRIDFIKSINAIFNIYTVLDTEEVFSDIGLETKDYFELMAAKRSGYIVGYADGSVRADNIITRTEAAVALDNLMELPQPMDGPVFEDQLELPSWAVGSIQRIVARGILSADEDGNFNGGEPLSKEDLENAVSAIKSLGLQGREDEIKTIKSFDGFEVTGRLSVPAGEKEIDKLVIFVHGTGPNTYEMRRQSNISGIRFKYLDIYADKFAKDGTGFFTYNTRGISLGDEEPYYADIDENLYKQYTPQNIAHDIKYIIEELKRDPRLEHADIILLGASEGTIIAPLAVSEYGAEADTLLLMGYCNDNMREVLEYQLGGGMSFFNYTQLFNVVGADDITKEQYEEDPSEIIEGLLGGAAFEDIDLSGDGLLTVEDFSIMMAPIKDGLFEAVENNDDKWIEENMATIMPPLMTDWFKSHFELSKTEDIMTKVDIPIYIFQGTYDANCPVQGTYDVQNRFEELGKENLKVHIYDGYDHELNFTQLLYGIGSKAFDDIFLTVENLNL
ncbi:S-layer homology domain-containing protein [Tissierella sp. Yu-01]|uniref:S-layer homology domain-containing protein n=1 Tax=Tissierella sp. Yu-01 TaxID=3035694 RepID=UPI00240DED5F|nr:S-layer homology domain-containing protein [Tissierella sp. Yu-01]WFA08013.1 S-layer homology domain-containing protein [Tissierella sp. Yu-01]